MNDSSGLIPAPMALFGICLAYAATHILITRRLRHRPRPKPVPAIEQKCENQPMTRYWALWLAATFTTFGVPEAIALATSHSENTLSWWIWKHAQVIRSQPIRDWSASHILFAGVFGTLAVWLIGHLIFGIWR